MAIGDFGAVLSDMEVLFTAGTAAGLTDVQLLERFLADGEAAGEAAFTALVKRHGPMVLRVCRGELNDLHAAEDAFQATFLILARQARTIRDRASLASWLYGVARRVARRARLDRARRAARERRGASMIEDQGRHAPEPPELLPEIQEEVDRLPERYRSAIVLCDLEGRTHEEAAGQLRIPVGTVKTRLSRGRERLRGRLIRRGLAPALIASSLAAPARAAIPAPLVDITVKAAMRVAAFRAAGVSATVAALAQGVLRAMLIHKLKTIAVLAAASMALIVTSIVLMSALSAPVRSEQEPGRPNVLPPIAKPDLAPAPEADRIREVAVATIKKAAFRRSTTQPGIVEPREKVDVLPTVSGHLRHMNVDIGDEVQGGDVLADIEAPELKLELAKAEAAVRQAKARIMTAESKVRVADSAVKAARADIKSVEAELRQAEATASYRQRQQARLAELVAKGAVEHRIAEEEEDRLRSAEATLLSAKARVLVAQANLASAEARLESTRADLAEVKEGLSLAQVDRKRAEMMLEACRIRSPLVGFVTRRNYSIGEFVRAAASGGSTPLYTLMWTSIVRIVTHVPDRDVPYVDVGDPVTFRADNSGGREFQGRVSRVAVAEDPATRSMRVEIYLDNREGRLRPGQRGQLQIALETRPASVALPLTAIRQGMGDGDSCFRVVDGRAVRTPIKLGESNEDTRQVQILEGLNEGDLVILDGHQVRVGQAVKPRPSAEAH
jgi:HlyD family secretion protein